MNLIMSSMDRCNKHAKVPSLTVTIFLLIVNVKGVSLWAMIAVSSDVSGETVDEKVDSAGDVD